MRNLDWHKPCYPLAAEEEPAEVTDILAGVKDHPVSISCWQRISVTEKLTVQ